MISGITVYREIISGITLILSEGADNDRTPKPRSHGHRHQGPLTPRSGELIHLRGRHRSGVPPSLAAAPRGGELLGGERPMGQGVEPGFEKAYSIILMVEIVGTSVAHLAGALGRPTWILLRFDTDWRWGLEADTTHWYPSARLYRQTVRGDWSEPLARIGVDLAAKLRQRAYRRDG